MGLFSGLFGDKDEAAEIQKRALTESTELQREFAEKGIERLERAEKEALPFRQSSFGALDSLLDLAGLARPKEGSFALSQRQGALGEGEELGDIEFTVPAESSARQLELLEQTPGVIFERQAAQQALERSAAAKGGLQSGGLLAELQNQQMGLAGRQFQQRAGLLQGIVGQSQQAQPQGIAGQVAGLQQGIGTTQANAALQRGQIGATEAGRGLLNLGGGFGGALKGAVAGSEVPGIGTAVGGLLGGLGGLLI